MYNTPLRCVECGIPCGLFMCSHCEQEVAASWKQPKESEFKCVTCDAPCDLMFCPDCEAYKDAEDWMAEQEHKALRTKVRVIFILFALSLVGILAFARNVLT